MSQQEVEQFVKQYGHKEHAIIMMLQDIQERYRNLQENSGNPCNPQRKFGNWEK